MIRIIILDDHQVITDSCSHIINEQKDMVCIATASNSSQAEKMCKTLKPDLVLADISIESSMAGIEFTKKIKAIFPQIKIILMSGFNEISYIPLAKEALADAFLSKAQPLENFLVAIRTVMNGEKVFPEPYQIPSPQGETLFTQRELEVLRLLCRSLTRKEIADELEISIGTVKRHIENMLVKSNCKSTMELVIYVVGNSWISPK